MHLSSRIGRFAGSSLSMLALIAGAIVFVGLSVSDADAQGGVFRKGVAKGENGAVSRSRGFVGNGEGSGAIRRGGFASDGHGNAIARRGGCASGSNGAGCRGGGATWGSDGSVSVRRGAEYSGDNGSFSSRRAFDRDAEGAVSASRSTNATGSSGSYAGASSLNDGVYSRDGVYTGSGGQSVIVDGTYERGAGGSRSVTCMDASGAVVTCP